MKVKEIYYDYIRKFNINDTFIYIIELSYTQKLQILTRLKTFYDNEQINMALNYYEINYIRLNRVDIKRIYNTLKGIIDRNNTN
jgi:hypothetical protein